jgi:phospholipid transport system substrate-binding protein
MNKLISIPLAALLALVFTASATAAPTEASESAATAAARMTLSATVDEVLEVLREAGANTDARIAELQEITDRRFNFSRMTKLVLGRNRKKLSEEQQLEFEQEFKRHLTVTYGHHIEGFAEEKVEIGASRLERNGEVTVKTKIVGGAADNVLVDYRMRENDGAWAIIDVIIEGVSLVQNFRAQIQEIVSTKGADQLIVVLREKNNDTGGGTGSD